MLLKQASKLDEADAFAKTVLNDEVFRQIVELIPLEWLDWNDTEMSPDEIRDVYFNFMKTRFANTEIFVNEAKNARG